MRRVGRLGLWIATAAVDVLFPFTSHWWERNPRWWKGHAAGDKS